LPFRGSFEHTLDSKQRLTVPAAYREAFADGAVLAASPETEAGTPRSVSIWCPADYDEYVRQTLGGLNPATPQARALERFFFNYSAEVDLDSANRLMIPPNLKRYAGLDQKVTIAGAGRYLEVFDRLAYDAYQDTLVGQISGLTASLAKPA
jgi:MraZ protein